MPNAECRMPNAEVGNPGDWCDRRTANREPRKMLPTHATRQTSASAVHVICYHDLQHQRTEKKMVKFLSAITFCILSPLFHAFSTVPSIARQRVAVPPLQMSSDTFELEVGIPPSNSGLLAQMKIKPVLEGGSEIIQVRYKIPFGLNVEPKNGFATVTQDGQGGEKVGDVLRFTSQWTMGLPRGNGLISTAASFSGGIGWQCSLFDVMKAKRWEEVVEALVSNVPQRTDEVVLIFERKLDNTSD